MLIGEHVTEVERERHRRIMVAIWAYAYEVENNSLVSDIKYDEEARKIDTSISTGHEILDKFFKEKFTPITGQWIYEHPEFNKVKLKYKQFLLRKK